MYKRTRQAHTDEANRELQWFIQRNTKEDLTVLLAQDLLVDVRNNLAQLDSEHRQRMMMTMTIRSLTKPRRG